MIKTILNETKIPAKLKEVKKDNQEVRLKEEKARDIIKNFYNSGTKASSLDFQRFATFYKLFRNKQTTKNYTGLSELFIPEPYRIIRKKTAKLANAIRSIQVKPGGKNDIESSKIGTHLLNFLRRKMNWHMTERTAIQEARITGLSWVKSTWNLGREKLEQPYLGFEFNFATADHVIVDPETDILDIFEGRLKRLLFEYDADFESLEKNPNYHKDILALLKNEGASKKESSSLDQARLSFQRSPITESNNKKFAIWEFWGRIDGKDMIIVIANKKHILRYDLNPYIDILVNPIPFIPFVGNPVGRELYPIGDIEPAESLFNEINDTRNQRMDTVTLNIDPMKILLKGANIDKKQLTARKGWYVESSVPNAIQVVPPDMQGVRAAIDEEKIIRGDIQQVTGVLDFAPGSDVQAGIEIDTARGAIIAKGEADVLTEDDITILKLSLQMLYRNVLAFAQEFLDRNFTIRVVEKGVENFYDVDKGSIQGNFDLDIEMKTLQDKTTDQQLKLMLLNIAKTIPGAKLSKFFVDVLEAFYENVNIAEYYEEPQPTQETPKINVSLKGELNPLQVADIAQQAGASKESGDPLLNPELRKLMGKLSRGQDVFEEDNIDLEGKKRSLQTPSPQSNE